MTRNSTVELRSQRLFVPKTTSKIYENELGSLFSFEMSLKCGSQTVHKWVATVRE
jgi:hypothetical protein